MKPLPALLVTLTVLLLPALVSAQCTVPGDQEPCDGNVSMTELTDYIDLWYGCSSCYPDMFEAIEAYYGIEPCTPECTGKVCGPDGCGGSCGTCSSGYVCQAGACVTTEPAFPQDYVSWWKFDSETGGITPDENTVNANDGTLNDDARILNDTERGYVLELDGTDDYVEVPDDPSFDIADEITVLVWINPLDVTEWRTIVSKFAHIPEDRKDLYWFLHQDQGNIGIALDDPMDNNWYADIPISTGIWTHVVTTYNGSCISMYKNGVIGDSVCGLSGAMSLATSSSNESFYIGMNTEWGEEDFYGLIDDVIIYNRSLSADEILQIYNLENECSDSLDCDDNNDCTIDVCDSSDPQANAMGCVYSNTSSGTTCDDGLYCTENNACDGSGNCLGDPKICPSDGVACTDEICSEPGGCENITNSSKCNTGEICDVLLSCIPDPCFGISQCSDYNETQCPNDPCNVPGICEWNSSSLQCEEKVISSDCTIWVDDTGTSGTGNSADDPIVATGNAIMGLGNPGDVICLKDGYYGEIDYSNAHNPDYKTIQAQPGHNPGFSHIHLSSCSNWIFRGLEISPELAPTYNPNRLFRVRGSSEDIILENSNLYYVQDSSGWSRSDWENNLAAYAVHIESPNIIVRNNTIKNVMYGFTLSGADNTTIEHNQIENIARDGIHVSWSNYVTIQYNILKNFYRTSSTAHCDAMQFVRANSDDPIVGEIVRGNYVIWKEPGETNPLMGSPMGINDFSEEAIGWIIENNVVLVSHTHGIRLDDDNGDPRDNIIVNNIAFDPTGTESPAISIGGQGIGSVYRNNMANTLSPPGSSATVDHNIDIDDYGHDVLFVDATGAGGSYDLHHKAGSPAIDNGSSELAPSIDIEGTTRPYGLGYDIGAYEYVG